MSTPVLYFRIVKQEYVRVLEITRNGIPHFTLTSNILYVREGGRNHGPMNEKSLISVVTFTVRHDSFVGKEEVAGEEEREREGVEGKGRE